MKTKHLLALLLLCTFLPSCANETPVSPQCDCSCDALLSEFLATMTEPEEEVTTVLWDGDRAMIEDVEKYGENVAREFFIWRHIGNPDIYESDHYFTYDSGKNGYVYIVPLQEEYSLSDDSLDNFGIQITGMSSHAQEKIYAWSHFLNLEKKTTEDHWERCAVLDVNRIGEYNDLQSITERLYDDKVRLPYAGPDGTHAQYLYMLSKNPILTIDTEQIYPELTPGEYRFIFYYYNESVGEFYEYCRQYVYFKVVE